MTAFEKSSQPLPRVIVDSLNHSYGASLLPGSRLNDVSSSVVASAGDLLSPLHLELAEIACADSPLHCIKMRFAAAAVDTETGEVLATGFNSRIRSRQLYGLSEPLYCQGDYCIRVAKDVSRTNALIGECEHAFLVMMLSLKDKEISLDNLKGSKPRIKMYEAGFYKPTDQPFAWLPWVAKEPFYTCLYCDDKLLATGIESVVTMKRLPQDSSPRWTDTNIRQSLIFDSGIAQTGYKSN